MTGPNGIVALKPEAAAWLRDGATVVPYDAAVFRVEGPGAVDCLQGVLTNDVTRAGTTGCVYGAMLTPKGMIVVDLWLLRDPEGCTLVLPRRGRAAAQELFARRMPPRLARVVEQDAGVMLLFGTRTDAVLEASGLAPPGPGSVSLSAGALGPLALARAGESAPWRAMLVGAAGALDRASASLQGAGALVGTEGHLEAARILSGWPSLGREIGDKTLPQEVRFDEIGGVSYTKGCYVGQETVARVHFRGHPNRMLRGLLWDEATHPPGAAVRSGEKEVGALSSVLAIGQRRYGLALLRREITPGSIVTVERGAARVAELPFPLEGLPEERGPAGTTSQERGPARTTSQERGPGEVGKPQAHEP